ncbi:MAG: undecaprenyl-diphosphate phosphatase [Alphaproteobacteria bacterium]|nr:undecaprenyl-diphosphate phosphatase [Alphaproteobacteria bacterium]
MLSLEQLVILALVQGVAEILPVSVSAHRVVPTEILGWPQQGPLFDLALHLGTLMAVCVHFRKDAAAIARGALKTARGRLTPDSRLFLQLALATVPMAIFAGLVGALDLAAALRSAEFVGWTCVLFGLALMEADRIGLRMKRMEEMTFKGAGVAGLLQLAALLPGVSRTGIAMTAGRFLGYERSEASRFAMLMSIPVSGALALAAAARLLAEGGAVLRGEALVVGAVSFLAAYGAIRWFMAFVDRIGFLPFAVYRLLLGAGLLAYAYVLA